MVAIDPRVKPRQKSTDGPLHAALQLIDCGLARNWTRQAKKISKFPAAAARNIMGGCPGGACRRATSPGDAFVNHDDSFHEIAGPEAQWLAKAHAGSPEALGKLLEDCRR